MYFNFKSDLTKVVNYLLPVVLLIEYLSSVFSKLSFWLDILAVLIILWIFLQLLLERNVRKADIFFLLFTLLLVFVTADITRVSILCVYVLFSLRKYYNEQTVKNCLNVSVVCLAVIVSAYLLFGFNKQYDTEIYRPFLGITVSRMCFGFAHPNQFTIYLLALTVLIYLATDNFLYYTFITAVDVVFFELTQSRTVLYVVLFLFIMLIAAKLLNLRKVKSSFLIQVIFFGFFILSLFLSVYFAESSLDVLLTGRLALNKQYLETGLSLFGTDAFDNSPFDNSYIHMIITKGIIYTVVYCILFAYMTYKTKLSWKNTMILTAIFLEAFMEVIFLKYCFMVIIPLLYKERKAYNYDTPKNSLLLVRESTKV